MCREAKQRVAEADFALDLSYLLRMDLPGGKLTAADLPTSLAELCNTEPQALA